MDKEERPSPVVSSKRRRRIIEIPPGAHAPLEDPTVAPEGYPIKGNANSMLYHVPGSRHYKACIAEVWFATPEDAEAAGFRKPKR